MVVRAAVFLMLAILAHPTASANDMHKARPTDILHIEPVRNSWESWATLRIHKSVPLKYWVNCDFYDRSSEIIASTNHVLLERVPTWKVRAKPKDIYFALCYVPN